MKYLDPIEKNKAQMLKIFQELKSDSSSLKQLISLFKLTGIKEHENIDIISLDFSIPKIVLINRDTKTIYTIEFTKGSDLLNCYSSNYQFISVTEEHHDKKIEYLYDLQYKPLVEKVSYRNGEYELALMKERSEVNPYSHYERATVSYSKEVDYHGNKLMQPLLTKVTKDNYKESVFDYRIENTYTYGDPSLVFKLNPEDNYSYKINDRIIYGTNESEEKGVVHYFCGVCFEDFNFASSRYLPYNIQIEDFSRLKNKNIKSGIIYKGGTTDAFHHILEIYKTDDNLSIKYYVTQAVKDENGFYNREEVINEDINIPMNVKDCISSSLIHDLSEELVSKYPDDIFIANVAEKLADFALKIAIKEDKVPEIMNSLDSGIIIDMPISEIISLVEDSDINYFAAMESELEHMIKAPIKHIKEKSL